ncbi:hypothetical protein NP493_582g00018 [Ridgeia piscesae]|uniref:Uncharacterized protein n=1 Tax=Ridgeia piscesae TaxID=27915 RepID=A0AAD9NP85_RIDPI|nr:hypothetical protein NP493_582g00018 [Ridgeia piscesae]
MFPIASQNGDRKPTYPSSTIGRFLKTLGRPGRKYTYKQYEGDLNAGDITMSEDDRIELMVLVKEGKLTMEQAVDTVKQFEYNRRDSFSDSQTGDGNNSEEDLRAYNPKDYTESSSASSSPSHMARSRTSSSVSPAREISASKSWKSKIPKSPHFFRARFSSPSRQGRRGSASSECSSTSSPREKVKSFFSSPFTRRKATGEASTLSMQGNHKKSDSSLDKFQLPPSGPRGCSTIAQRLRQGSPSRSHSTGDEPSIIQAADSSHRNSTGAKCSQVIDEARPQCTRSGRFSS